MVAAQMHEEKVILSVDDVEIYDNDIEEAIADACAKLGIDDLVKEGQRRWKAVLQYVGEKVFPDRGILKSHVLNLYNNNTIPTNNNRYDYELLDMLCDYYIYLSNQYDKFVSTEAFSYFINIPTNTIDKWRETEPSTVTFQIWKKLQRIRLESLKDDALDNGNVTGTIAVGNWEYNLNMPGVKQDDSHKKALSITELAEQLKIEQKSDNLENV